MNHKVVTSWKGGLTFESDNPSGKTLILDTDVEGQVRKGLSPKAMMLSSLAGCSGLDVLSILDKMKVEVEDFKIEVIGELTDQHPKYYHKVMVNYYFYGNNLNEERCQRAVQLSVDKYCGVMEMFRQFADLQTNIYFKTKS